MNAKLQIPVLSPARQALDEHQRKIRALELKISDADAPLAKLREAETVEQQRKADLAAVLDADTRAVSEWVEGGTVGLQPQPDVEARQRATRAWAAAKAMADIARRVAGDLVEKCAGFNAESGALMSRLAALKRAVLVEEAERLGAEFRELATQATEHWNQLIALSRTFGGEPRTFAPDGVNLGELGRSIEGMTLGKLDSEEMFRRGKQAWTDLWYKLDTNATAKF